MMVLVSLLSLPAMGLNVDSVKVRFRHTTFYGEVLGHNYFSYSEQVKLASSINIGYRFQCIPSKINLEVSLGWGTFSETFSKQVPFQPTEYYKSRIHFIPVEVALLFGRQIHFFDLGCGYASAWGDHSLRYKGANGSTAIRMQNYGGQFVLRVGYSCFMKNGIRIRVGFTPHFYDSSLERYQGMSIYKERWIPVGVSVGYSI